MTFDRLKTIFGGTSDYRGHSMVELIDLAEECNLSVRYTLTALQDLERFDFLIN